MPDYPLAGATFTTPKGNSVGVTYRQNTSDWNTIYSCLSEDEYGLAHLDLKGDAADIGAHIGGATLALLADNPELHVTAIEAVPENAGLLRQNVEQNGFGARCTVINGAVGGAGASMARIHYRYVGNEIAEHHAFIGNVGFFPGHGPDHCPNEIEHSHADVPVITLDDLVGQRLLSFVKIDCEGGEWDFLADGGQLLRRVARWHGEWHPTTGHVQSDLKDALADFDVRFLPQNGPDGPFVPVAGPGGFTATLR